MSDVKNSIFAAGGVAAAAIAVVLGAGHRQSVDIGGGGTGPTLGGMLASRDKQVSLPATDYFQTISEKLKREYVEPVTDDMKLATGAVRGMVGSLADPKSLYMDEDEFRAFLNARQGQYEGIGVDLVLEIPNGGQAAKDFLQPTPGEEASEPGAAAPTGTSPGVPRLVVASVVPGGPADKAGVKPGDVVDTVDGHWVYNNTLLSRFRKAQRDYETKKISQKQLNELRNQVRAKFDKAILPLKAKDKLVLGDSGIVKVVWERGGATRTTPIQRAPSKRPGFSVQGDTIQLPLTAGVAGPLRAAIAGKDAVTLDLRQNVLGDFKTMREVLTVLAPSGDYGVLAGQKGATALRVTNGNASPPKLTLLVDETTRGAAEVLALALSSKGRAKLSGRATGGDRTQIDVIALPDGSGYTLATAQYRPTLPTKKETAR